MGKTTGMLGGMLHVVRKLPGKSILGYFAIYPRINGQVSKDTLPSKLASVVGLESAQKITSSVGKKYFSNWRDNFELRTERIKNLGELRIRN